MFDLTRMELEPYEITDLTEATRLANVLIESPSLNFTRATSPDITLFDVISFDNFVFHVVISVTSPWRLHHAASDFE